MSKLEYVTVAEIGFAPYLLNLYKSLERHAGSFHLSVACVDEDLLALLSTLDLSHVSLLDLSHPSDQRLAAARSSRSIGEYCWTLTPFLPGLVFENRTNADSVTYIDADVWLLRAPDPIHEEFERSGAAALITPHAFAPDWDASHSSGYYCVQYMPFRRSDSSDILTSWGNQCLAECSADGGAEGLGDQGYLTAWPETYGERVHVTDNPNWFQGPWNCERFPYSEGITYHFHGVRLRSQHRVWLGTNPVPAPTMREVYEPYIQELADSARTVAASGFPLRFWPHPMSRFQQVATMASRVRRQAHRFLPARSRSFPHG